MAVSHGQYSNRNSNFQYHEGWLFTNIQTSHLNQRFRRSI